MSLLPWGLFRRPDGSLEVAHRAFADSTWRRLSMHETKPAAAEALKTQAALDKLPPPRQEGLWS